jgi:hypothetical protein
VAPANDAASLSSVLDDWLFLGCLKKQTSSWPCRINARAVANPMVPDAPNKRTRMDESGVQKHFPNCFPRFVSLINFFVMQFTQGTVQHFFHQAQ